MTVSNASRKLIIESYNNGNGIKQLSNMFNIKYCTIYAIIAVYKKEDRFEQKLKGDQRKKNLDQVHIETIKGWIGNDCG